MQENQANLRITQMIQNVADAAEFIVPLHVNGMDGRMLRLPAKKKQTRELLVIYGHHSSLERWWGLVQNFNDFGTVTMPDLPGFGGMDSFYTIGRQATLDDYADYMAAFIKMQYRRKKVTIVGISWGFLVATRMLQRYPELTQKVEVLVSAMGFMHHNNFTFSPARYKFYRIGARVASIYPLPFLFRHLFLTAPLLRAFYARTNNAKHKFAQAASQEELDAMMDMEVELWQSNEVRSYMRTTTEMLTLDHTEEKINLPVWHVHTPDDNYFDNQIIEQQMRVVFSDVHPVSIAVMTHAPSVVASKEESAIFVPKEIRTMLRANTKKASKKRK